jgi:hypothetical protein
MPMDLKIFRKYITASLKLLETHNGIIHILRNPVFRYFLTPPTPFVMQNRTNSHLSNTFRNAISDPPTP